MSEEITATVQAVRLSYDIAKDIVKALKAILEKKGSDLEVEAKTVTKNGVEKEAALVGAEDSNVKATVYLDDSIEKIQNGESTVEEEAEAAAKCIEFQVNEKGMNSARGYAKELDNPDKSKIKLQVVNSDLNREMLEHTPHRDVAGDLSLIGRYYFDGEASTVITDDLATHMGLTGTEVLEIGQSNIKHEEYSVKHMGEMIADMMGMPMDEAQEMFPQEQKMLVVTNESKIHGATGLFANPELREQVAEKLGGDFLILPSSLHEVICIPKDSLSVDEAKDMISSVNQTELRPEDILSDHPYACNASTLKVSNPCQAEEIKEVAGAVRHASAGR
ncbi:MAG: hypothetical protein IJ796_09185 [Lachnospiraceae bacterium]|nr:hypothetical protein [Lachnospiraceae bacterium]